MLQLIETLSYVSDLFYVRQRVHHVLSRIYHDGSDTIAVLTQIRLHLFQTSLVLITGHSDSVQLRLDEFLVLVVDYVGLDNVHSLDQFLLDRLDFSSVLV